MKFLVLSDTHGSHRNIEIALSNHPDAQHVFFCGDGLREIYDEIDLFTDRIFHIVSGNCDFMSQEQRTDCIILQGKKIVFTHGHDYKVKYGLSLLLSMAKSRNADIVLYGHTHRAHNEYLDEMYVLNPGSASNSSYKPSYGIVEITSAGIMTNIAYF